MGFVVSGIHPILVLVSDAAANLIETYSQAPRRFRKQSAYIRRRYPEHHRLGPESQSTTLTAHIQPVPAIIGLVGSILLVFVFPSSTWWSEPASLKKVAVAYGAVRCQIRCCQYYEDKLTESQPIVLLVLFAILKVFSRRGWVKITPDLVQLQFAIEILKSSKAERSSRPPRRVPWRRLGSFGREKSDRSEVDGERFPGNGVAG